ncbi:MAG TPA: hypothetical protein VFB12_29925 [Ktedonobacteraceae bacterium]|nr:hypothetical protein [Ktedonobacteraceae bacterium]
MEVKPTLMKLRRDYNEHTDTLITSQQLAEADGVPLADEFTMELGRPVSIQIANKILNPFNTLTGQHYTFTDVEVTLKETDQSVTRSQHGYRMSIMTKKDLTQR